MKKQWWENQLQFGTGLPYNSMLSLNRTMVHPARLIASPGGPEWNRPYLRYYSTLRVRGMLHLLIGVRPHTHLRNRCKIHSLFLRRTFMNYKVLSKYNRKFLGLSKRPWFFFENLLRCLIIGQKNSFDSCMDFTIFVMLVEEGCMKIVKAHFWFLRMLKPSGKGH